MEETLAPASSGSEKRINRAGNGRGMYQSLMRPGVSGNPNGRPKKIPTAQEVFERKVKQDLKSAARDYSAEALQTLIDIMRDKECAPQYRLTAASTILDRGHGKAVNQTEISIGVYDKLSDAELVKFITGSDVIDLPRQDVEDLEDARYADEDEMHEGAPGGDGE